MATDIILITSKKEERERKLLSRALEKKKLILLKITAKYESLKMDLEIIQHEYNVRVGRLFLRDNQLDLEIIRLKNFKSLLLEGYTHDEVEKILNDKFYSDDEEARKKEEEIEREAEILSKRKNISEDIEKKFKTLWKKMIFKYHPDLVTDLTEKKYREDMMKRINEAYSHNDYEALKGIENHYYVDNHKELPIDKLRKVFVDLENKIIAVSVSLRTLKESQWYGWKRKYEKSKKTNKDIFLELEKMLLDDILKKLDILRELKKEIRQTGAVISE